MTNGFFNGEAPLPQGQCLQRRRPSCRAATAAGSYGLYLPPMALPLLTPPSLLSHRTLLFTAGYGYGIVIAFGIFFSVVTSFLVW